MRYESEIALRLYGDREAAAKYVNEGRRILGEVWNRDIVLGGLDQAWRRVDLTDNVTVSVYATRYHAPIVRIFVQPVGRELPEAPFLLLAAWYPEGLVFTPTTAQLTDGRGLPSRDPASGDVLTYPEYTDNGIMSQVLMNRFANNRYLDKGAFVSGTRGPASTLTDQPPWLRDTYDDVSSVSPSQMRYAVKVARPLDYDGLGLLPEYVGFDFWTVASNQQSYPVTPGEYVIVEELIAGQVITTAILVQEQKDYITGADLIFEGESLEWFAHRAEEVLYATPAHEAIFTKTNDYRGEVGAPPVHRMLRGDANPAAIAVTECVISGDFSHNSLDFRPGFRTADGKVLAATGVDQASGENLAAGASFEGLTQAVGENVANAWKNSLGHYKNMINEAWDNTNTVPGASHAIGYTVGTVDRTTEDIPDIASFPGQPVTGGIWSQCFHKREMWVQGWKFTYEGIHGLTGWDGISGYHDNSALATVEISEQTPQVVPYRAYFGFRGCRYVCPSSAEEDRTIRVLGVAVYSKEVEMKEQLWFRVAILLNDVGADFLNQTPREYGDGVIQVYTAPVGVTEANYKDRYGYYEPDPNREWDLEGEIELPFALDETGEGWLYSTFATAAISPDGRKFCFSYQKYKVAEDTPVHYRSSRDMSITTTRDFMVTWTVHIEKDVGGDFVQHAAPPPAVTVASANVRNTPGNCRNTFTRSVNTKYNYMPVYDDENQLDYVKLDINDYQSQGLGGHYWRVRKLVFPSGKEVLTDYQFMIDFETPADIQSMLESHGAPVVVDEDEPFNAIIHHINPNTEDVLLTRSYLRTSFKAYNEADDLAWYAPGLGPGSDPIYVAAATNTLEVLGLLDWYSQYGDIDLMVDLGNGKDREVEVLCRKSTTINAPRFLISRNQFLANNIGAPVTAGIPWTIPDPQGAPTVFQLDTVSSYCVYNYKSPVAITGAIYVEDEFDLVVNGLPYPEGIGWYGSSSQSTHMYFYGQYSQIDPQKNNYDEEEYGSYDTQGMYNVTNYEASVWQPPATFGQPGKDNLFQSRSLFSDKVTASLYTDNLAPLTTDYQYEIPQLVRYKDRVMVRVEMHHLLGQLNDRVGGGPYLSAQAASDAINYPLPYTTDDVEHINCRVTQLSPTSDTQILIWSNFDVDTVAGMIDVTDIDPLGRAV